MSKLINFANWTENENQADGRKLYLDKIIDDADRHDNNKEHRGAVADDADGTHDAKCTDDPRVQTAWQLRVNDVDVFRETVYDATYWSAVEERHRCPESAL